jgi:hypothetical protein
MLDYWLLRRFHYSFAGEGRLLTICDVDSPPAYPVMTHMNFKKDIFASVLSSMNWATVQENYTPGRGLAFRLLVLTTSLCSNGTN